MGWEQREENAKLCGIFVCASDECMELDVPGGGPTGLNYFLFAELFRSLSGERQKSRRYCDFRDTAALLLYSLLYSQYGTKFSSGENKEGRVFQEQPVLERTG